MGENKGFIGSLFDLSFSEFVTTRIIKLLFVLAIIGSGIGTLVLIIGTFASHSVAFGILSLVLSPLIFFIYVIVARVYLEIIIVIFRIAENTSRLVKQDNDI
jgi:hypothetical protein